ncbi:uncharacterized protein isoform X3 [Danio rerio]|uniref:Uncharacterized protein isoform X3 n=1 Tax=Danio rerio TaxID=7955 RepID=A0AC58GU34_DANRE
MSSYLRLLMLIIHSADLTHALILNCSLFNPSVETRSSWTAAMRNLLTTNEQNFYRELILKEAYTRLAWKVKYSDFETDCRTPANGRSGVVKSAFYARNGRQFCSHGSHSNSLTYL